MDTKNRNKIFVCLLLNFIVIILSESRIGLASFTFFIALFIFRSAWKNPFKTVLISIFLGILSLPLLSIVIEKISKRISSDTGVETNFVLFSDSFAFTMSGRTIIWEAYINQFFKLVEKDFFILFLGAGFQKLIPMYQQSFLSLIGISINPNFFPLHSDILLIFISTGICGLLLWILSVVKIVANLLAHPNFIVGCFLWVLIVFSLIDMLNYSLFSSVLIGMGLSFNKKSFLEEI